MKRHGRPLNARSVCTRVSIVPVPHENTVHVYPSKYILVLQEMQNLFLALLHLCAFRRSRSSRLKKSLLKMITPPSVRVCFTCYDKQFVQAMGDPNMSHVWSRHAVKRNKVYGQQSGPSLAETSISFLCFSLAERKGREKERFKVQQVQKQQRKIGDKRAVLVWFFAIAPSSFVANQSTLAKGSPAVANQSMLMHPCSASNIRNVSECIGELPVRQIFV